MCFEFSFNVGGKGSSLQVFSENKIEILIPSISYLSNQFSYSVVSDSLRPHEPLF